MTSDVLIHFALGATSCRLPMILCLNILVPWI